MGKGLYRLALIEKDGGLTLPDYQLSSVLDFS